MKINKELIRTVRENAEKITESSCFVVIFNEKMIEDVIPLVQMGLAVYQDKPIYLLVRESEADRIPENLRRMARSIEIFRDEDTMDLQRATMALLRNHVGG